MKTKRETQKIAVVEKENYPELVDLVYKAACSDVINIRPRVCDDGYIELLGDVLVRVHEEIEG